MAELTYDDVSKLLKADFQTGKLYWLPREPGMFKAFRKPADAACQTWNTKYAGKEAFTAKDGRGYFYGQIYKKPYRAHRVIWLLHFGEWPKGDIDHINGIRTDNYISNIRDVTISENRKNSCLGSNNTSGYKGINFCKTRGLWRARIVSGVERHIGYFESKEEAIEARRAEEAKLGFHPNHGRLPQKKLESNPVPASP